MPAPDVYGTLAHRGGPVGATDTAARPASERHRHRPRWPGRRPARGQWRTSPDTLLRLVRVAPAPDASAPQIIGVDEWAWRRGQRYGTMLVTLEDHHVIELLPERSAESVAAWLAQQPTILVICRDRRALYAEGIRRGAPAAVQVVDRFPLVKNLRDTLEAFLHNHRSALQAAAVATAQALTPPAGLAPATPMDRGRRQGAQTRQERMETEQQRRHAPWVATYEAIHTMYT
jgi:transposase